jgi:hypothetical protein
VSESFSAHGCVVGGNALGRLHPGIHVAALDDDPIGLPAPDIERIVVPLSGGFLRPPWLIGA